MDDSRWYSGASLEKPGHILCIGLLTNGLRKWTTLSNADRALATLKLSKPVNNRLRLEAGEIEGLAKKLDGRRL